MSEPVDDTARSESESAAAEPTVPEPEDVARDRTESQQQAASTTPAAPEAPVSPPAVPETPAPPPTTPLPAPPAGGYAPPAYQASPPYPGVPQPAAVPRAPLETADRLAIASLVSVAFMFVCGCCGVVAVIPSIVGIILGVLGLKASRYKWMAIVGIAAGSAVILFYVVLFILYGATMGLGLLSSMSSPDSY